MNQKRIWALFFLCGSLQAASLSFMQEAKNQTLGLIAKILTHPFVLEIANGTLSPDKFKYYSIQDNKYSWRYADALSLIASKTFNSTEKLFFLEAAYDSTQEWSGDFPDDVIEQCASCEAYSDFELACVQRSYTLGIASIAPCYVVYAAVATWLLAHSTPHNPYQAWINEYAAPGFEKHVLILESIVNRIANETSSVERERMLAAYEKSVRYEWMFWNSAYNLSTWEPHENQR